MTGARPGPQPKCLSLASKRIPCQHFCGHPVIKVTSRSHQTPQILIVNLEFVRSSNVPEPGPDPILSFSGTFCTRAPPVCSCANCRPSGSQDNILHTPSGFPSHSLESTSASGFRAHSSVLYTPTRGFPVRAEPVSPRRTVSPPFRQELPAPGLCINRPCSLHSVAVDQPERE